MMIIIGKKVWLILFFVILVSAIVLVSAYKNGQAVLESPTVQWVSHTEYWSSSGPGATEVASTIVRLTDYKGDPFNVDSCSVTILYPDKSVYLRDQPMVASPVVGNWYRADPIPDMEGTYEQGVTCLYGAGKSVKTSQSFHVNPALNYIKTVNANIVASDTKLSSVNLTIVGKVQDAKSEINTNINVSSATLSNLMGLINSSLSGQLVGVEGNLNTKMSNVQAVIQGEVEGINTTIVSRISLSETNLRNLIDSVNGNLSNQLTNAQVALDSKISNVNVSLTGVMEHIEANIISRVNVAEINLSNLINQVNSDLSSQLNIAKGDISEDLRSVNITLNAQIGDAKTAIQTQLTGINASISELVQSLQNDVMDYLSLYLPTINKTTSDIYSDTRWLVENSMNQQDAGKINERFDSIDANITLIENFCSNIQTSGSKLCDDLKSLNRTLQTIRNEQQSYFNSLNETTTSTWDFLSGSINIKIDNLLADIGLIKGQTLQINKTLEEWRANEESRVFINPLS